MLNFRGVADMLLFGGIFEFLRIFFEEGTKELPIAFDELNWLQGPPTKKDVRVMKNLGDKRLANHGGTSQNWSKF